MRTVTIRYRKSTEKWHIRVSGVESTVKSYGEKEIARIFAEGLFRGLGIEGDKVRLVIYNEDGRIADILELN